LSDWVAKESNEFWAGGPANKGRRDNESAQFVEVKISIGVGVTYD